MELFFKRLFCFHNYVFDNPDTEVWYGEPTTKECSKCGKWKFDIYRPYRGKLFPWLWDKLGDSLTTISK